MNSILLLYDSILAPVLVEWIGDVDLCLLDTAICNRLLRNKFLDIVSKCKIVNTSVVKSNEEEYHEWIVMRNMGLKRFNFGNMEDSNVSVAVRHILKRTILLDHVQVSSAKLLVSLINEYKLNILSCVFTERSNDDDILMVLHACPNLTALDVAACHSLTSQVCDTICKYGTQLKTLRVPEQINISEFFSMDHCQLVHLKCGLETLVPTGIVLQTLVKLEYFDVTFDAMKALINACPNLECLDIDSDDINDGIFLHLTNNCKRISSLIVGSRNLTDVSAGLIAMAYKGLSLLKLYATDITDVGVSNLVMNLPLLTELDLNNSINITNQAMKSIQTHCKRLQCLSVDGCMGLTELGLTKMFQKCPELKILSFHDVLVSGAFLCHNAVNFTNILFQKKDYDLCSFVSYSQRSERVLKCSGLDISECFSFVFCENPNLQKIEFNKLYITDALVEMLVIECPFLSEATFHDCTGITNAVFSHLMKCKYLKSFIVRGLDGITTDDIRNLLQNNCGITSVVLPACTTISDETLEVIAKYCPELLCLNLRLATEITSEGLINVLNHCSKLNTLNLKNCSKIDNRVLNYIRGRRMRTVYINDCNISQEEIQSFLDASGQCISEFRY